MLHVILGDSATYKLIKGARSRTLFQVYLSKIGDKRANTLFRRCLLMQRATYQLCQQIFVDILFITVIFKYFVYSKLKKPKLPAKKRVKRKVRSLSSSYSYGV